MAEVWKSRRLSSTSAGYVSLVNRRSRVMIAIAGTGYGLIGLLVIVLLVVLIFYFIRRA